MSPSAHGADETLYFPMSITLNDRDAGNRDTQITWSLKAAANADNVWRRPAQWQTVAMVGRNVLDTPQMAADINLENVGPDTKDNIKIRPRAPGSVDFKVKATDPEGQSVEDIFKLTVISKTAPIVKTNIPDWKSTCRNTV